ncbi:hypothetical protein KP78_07350 [Jeotgalibacillus soli]|uniref:Uncharacterized protein n=1 Tax=Jeotgalibacillus soli TaxID=889306 RepID=A0A0C2VK37_9BACL|nr:hypothetical protein KP78_07350 [Jeotgalibacillus soli]
MIVYPFYFFLTDYGDRKKVPDLRTTIHILGIAPGMLIKELTESIT